METLISGSGLQSRFLNTTGRRLSAREILEDAVNPVCLALQADFFQDFGHGLSQVIGLLDPDVVVMGGGLSGFDRLYTEGLASIQRQVFGGEWRGQLVPNRLGDSAGVIGAAWLARLAEANPPVR